MAPHSGRCVPRRRRHANCDANEGWNDATWSNLAPVCAGRASCWGAAVPRARSGAGGPPRPIRLRRRERFMTKVTCWARRQYDTSTSLDKTAAHRGVGDDSGSQSGGIFGNGGCMVGPTRDGAGDGCFRNGNLVDSIGALLLTRTAARLRYDGEPGYPTTRRCGVRAASQRAKRRPGLSCSARPRRATGAGSAALRWAQV